MWRSRHKATAMLSPSVPPPPPSPCISPTSLLSQAPGAASILLSPLFTHYLSLLTDGPSQVFLDNLPVSSPRDQVPSLFCSPLMPPPLCLGVSYDGATSTLLPPRVATTFSHAAPLVPSPGSRSTTIVLSKRSFLHLRGCLLCMPAPARLSCLLPPPPSPSPGLGLFLWCREPRREALASSRTSCSPMLQAGASFPEEALFGVQWRLLPGDNNLLVPL